MNPRGQILIIDSTGNRRKELRSLWCDILGYDVLSYDGGSFLNFGKDGQPAAASVDELSEIRPLACLFHTGDFEKYKKPEIKSLVDSCRRVVLFSGVGLAERKADWPLHWFWIPRAISGKASARGGVWSEFGDWLATKPSSSDYGVNIELLSVPKRPHFLIALYILCQGFLAGERMRARVPSAVAQTRKREWWSVPLLQSAGDNLVDVIKQEWGAGISISVLKLVEWIADKPDTDAFDIAEIVADATKELESRLAK